MGDRIAILRDGALVQYDTPEAILMRPADAFVEAFVGSDRALKRLALMSVSSFHHHFKALTGMSPLQFQKQLRLGEARRLMLTEDLDAATAAYRVGYESASQFSREYGRQFGAPPLRDISALRQLQSAR